MSGAATVLQSGARAVAVPGPEGPIGGVLAWPVHPSGFVVFADPGWSRPERLQNFRLAAQLRAAGLGTMLLDAAPAAGGPGALDDADRLAERLGAVTTWLAEQPEAAGLPRGYLGRDLGAAAALAAAASSPVAIEAVVARGGRPDILGERLRAVRSPTLLLVGSADGEAMRLNRAALERLGGPKRLVAITGAGRRFEEAGKLEEVGRWAAEWLVHYLAMERTWRAAGHRRRRADDE